MSVDEHERKRPVPARPGRGLPNDFGVRLGRVVTSIATAVGPGVHVGVLVADGAVRTGHGSDAVATSANNAQFDQCDGPGAHQTPVPQTLLSEDLAREVRWPHFTAIALDLGLRSVLCHRSGLSASVVLSIVLYCAQVGAFDEESVALIGLLSIGTTQVLTGTGRGRGWGTSRR